MSLLQELKERRVLPFVSAYVVGSWGLVQFVTFLEGRLLLSPHLVNAFGLALALLLPSVIVLAWCHGRPGADRWGRTEKFSIPLNLTVTIVVLLLVFADKDLGAVTETVALQDEDGTTIERVVPKAEFRSRAFLSYLENGGDPADDWLRKGLTIAMAVDLNQDPFIDVEYPPTRIAALRREGHADGLDVPRPLLREIAREAHCPHLVTGRFVRDEAGYTLDLEVFASGKGRRESAFSVTAPDLYSLVDEASVRLRREVGVPAAHLEEQQDLPVADVLTADLDAYRSFVEAVDMATHAADFEGALRPLEDALDRDPGFAAAHFLGYALLIAGGDEASANDSMSRAMENLYRLAERSQFQVKAIYYYNVKQDPDKAVAVLEMWVRLYPYDVAAYQQIAAFAYLRGQHEATIEALEKILEIDPAQHQVLVQLAEHHQEQGNLPAAEAHLLRYAELYPNEARSFTQLADLYLEFGRLDQARAALEQAQLIAPDRPATMRDLAEIDILLGRFDEAAAALQTLRASADNDQDRLAAIGHLMALERTRGRWHRSRALLDDWNELALTMTMPSQVWLAHGLRLTRITIPAHADSVYRDIHALRPLIGMPNEPIVGMCEAAVLTMSGRFDEAEAALAETEALVEAYQVEVLRPRVLTVRGVLAEDRGDLEEAREIHARGLELDPTSGLHMRRLGRLQRLTGQPELAETTLAAAHEKNPGQPDTNLEMALLLHEVGRKDEARAHLERALAAWSEAVPGHPGAAAARQLEAKLDDVP